MEKLKPEIQIKAGEPSGTEFQEKEFPKIPEKTRDSIRLRDRIQSTLDLFRSKLNFVGLKEDKSNTFTWPF